MITEKEYVDAINLVKQYKKGHIPKSLEEVNSLRHGLPFGSKLLLGDRIKFTISYSSLFNFITPDKWYIITRIRKNKFTDDYYLIDDSIREQYITISDVAYVEPIVEKRKRKLNFLD
jgi:hypothetical protein